MPMRHLDVTVTKQNQKIAVFLIPKLPLNPFRWKFRLKHGIPRIKDGERIYSCCYLSRNSTIWKQNAIKLRYRDDGPIDWRLIVTAPMPTLEPTTANKRPQRQETHSLFYPLCQMYTLEMGSTPSLTSPVTWWFVWLTFTHLATRWSAFFNNAFGTSVSRRSQEGTVRSNVIWMATSEYDSWSLPTVLNAPPVQQAYEHTRTLQPTADFSFFFPHQEG